MSFSMTVLMPVSVSTAYRALIVVCCCLNSFAQHAASQDACGQQIPDGCKVYTGGECDRRYQELNTISSGNTAWPLRVQGLQMQPFISDQSQSVSLALTWTPHQGTLQSLKGVKLSVTPQDDASQFTFCHLLDFSLVQWKQSDGQCMMAYEMPLPRMPGAYNWYIQLESLPSPVRTYNWSDSVADRIFDTVSPAAENPGPVCSATVLMDETSINVTMGVDVTGSPGTSNVTIQYRFDGDKCCGYCPLTYDVNLITFTEGNGCDYCSEQTLLNTRTVTSPGQVSLITDVPPALYRVWVSVAGNVDHRCNGSAVLDFRHLGKPTLSSTKTSSLSKAASTTTTPFIPVTTTSHQGTVTSTPSSPRHFHSEKLSTKPSYSTTAVSTGTHPSHTASPSLPRHFHYEKPSTKPSYSTTAVSTVTHSSHIASLPENAARAEARLSPSNDDDWKMIIASSIAVFVSVVVLLVGVAACYCLRRRASSHSFVDDLPCMEKLITSRANQSAASSELSGPVAVIPTAPPQPALSVYLVSHSSRKHHTLTTDSLAVYLQAYCACDVTYFRWQMDNMRLVGPECWTTDQMDKADRVVFVHSPETQDCYEAWKKGELCDGQSVMPVRALAAVFDHVCEVRKSPGKWFNVTFLSDLTIADHLKPPTRASSACEGVASTSNSEYSGKQKDSSCKSDVDFSRADAGSRCMPNFMETFGLAEARLYRLMNDFSQLLSDLHNVPNNPSAFRGRNLPIDSDHLETLEGRELCTAVASLRQSCKESKAVGDDSGGNGRGDGVQRMDSGFDEYSISFISPDELSAADTDAGSLWQRFQDVNARYERHQEENWSRSECDTLGGRCV